MIILTFEHENRNIASKNATKNIAYYSDLPQILPLLFIATPNEFLKKNLQISLFS